MRVLVPLRLPVSALIAVNAGWPGLHRVPVTATIFEEFLSMSYEDYLPANWIKKRGKDEHPLISLRREVDSLFDSFGDGLFGDAGDIRIRSNLSETDKEYRITAELPGMTEKDVDVSVSGDRIVIKGEKKSESEEKGRAFHRIERRSGAFQRMMSLPFEIPAESVEAKVKDGVLTVTIAKPAEVVAKTTKIKVAHAD
jgi:HSP20 family protein